MPEETETRGVFSYQSKVMPGSIIQVGSTYYEVQGVHLGGLKEVDYLTLLPILGETMQHDVNVGKNTYLRHETAYFTVPYRMLEGKRWWQSAAIMACEAHSTAKDAASYLRAPQSVGSTSAFSGLEEDARKLSKRWEEEGVHTLATPRPE